MRRGQRKAAGYYVAQNCNAAPYLRKNFANTVAQVRPIPPHLLLFSPVRSVLAAVSGLHLGPRLMFAPARPRARDEFPSGQENETGAPHRAPLTLSKA